MSNLNVCMVIFSRKQDDDKMRPGTLDPGMHWAQRLVDSVSTIGEDGRTQPPEGLYTRYDEGTLQVIMEPRVNPDILEHVMAFAKQHDLTYEFPNNMKRCAICPGHPQCLANSHLIK